MSPVISIGGAPNFRIQSLDDPRVAFFRDLKGQHPRLSASGQILIEGEEQLRRAMACGVKLKRLFCEEQFVSEFAGSALSDLEVLVGERELLQQIVGYRLHRGLMALADRPADTGLAELEFPALALNAVTDPENVGEISRSAAAFGFRSIVFDRESSDPFSRRAIRVSVGGVFGLKICAVESLEELFSKDLYVYAVECGGE